MPFVYKINVLAALKAKNISTYKIRKDNLFSQSTITKFNNNDCRITLENLLTVCKLLNCQPGDIIEYVPDNND